MELTSLLQKSTSAAHTLQVLATEGSGTKSQVTTDGTSTNKGSASSSVSIIVPAEEPTTSTIPDVTVAVSACPDAPPTEAALQDVSCPASIIEI